MNQTLNLYLQHPRCRQSPVFCNPVVRICGPQEGGVPCLGNEMTVALSLRTLLQRAWPSPDYCYRCSWHVLLKPAWGLAVIWRRVGSGGFVLAGGGRVAASRPMFHQITATALHKNRPHGTQNHSNFIPD